MGERADRNVRPPFFIEKPYLEIRTPWYLSNHPAGTVAGENKGAAMLSSLSKLTPGQIAEIHSLEQKLGKTLLSFSSYDVVAENLSPDDLAMLKTLEEKLGTMLVAVREINRKP